MLRMLIVGIWLLVLAAGIGWLLWRRGELREVRQENFRRQEQLASDKPAPASPRPSDQAATQPSTPPLTAEERTELLTLRGEVARLLRDLPAASNRLAQATRPAPAAPESVAEMARQQAMERIRNLPDETRRFHRVSHQIGQLLRAHLEAHDGRLPESLAGWEAAAQLDAEAADLLGRLELIPNNPIPPEARAYTFVAREREARQDSDGKWSRGYILGDGGITVGGPVEEPDWSRFERLQTGMAREEARKEAARGRSPAPAP